MILKRGFAIVAVVAPLLATVPSAHAVPVGFTLDVTTVYQFGGTDAGQPVSITANPDTAFISFQNNGASTFTGTMQLLSTSAFLVNESTAPFTLLPGQTSPLLAGTNEDSNQGGFNSNGAFPTPQNGLELILNGTISLGGNSEAVSLTVFDKDIHSGVPRTSPCDGIANVDSYVMSGGSPAGCDNGDGFETTQAPGHFEFFEASGTAVPEPGSLLLVGTGLFGISLARGIRRKKSA